MEALNDVLLKLANSPTGPEYERLKLMYLYIFENVIKIALPFNTIKVNHAIDLAFANFKRQTKGKHITSIDEFEQAIVDRFVLHETVFIIVPPKTKAIIKTMVADARMKKIKFWKKYYALYTRAICKELTKKPLEVHILVRESFSRLIFKNGPIDKPNVFFERMLGMIPSMAATKGYEVMPIKMPAPEPKDGCAPGMTDVINEKTYKRWDLLESRKKQTWVQKVERRMQAYKRKQEYVKRKQTARPYNAGYK